MGEKFNLEYEGRVFIVGFGFDVWLYHLGYLATQEAESSSWLYDWGKYAMDLALPFRFDFEYEAALQEFTVGYTDKARVGLLIDLSRKVLDRLQNYERFLETEIPKWDVSQGTEWDFADKLKAWKPKTPLPKPEQKVLYRHSDFVHADMLGLLSLRDLPWLISFAEMIVKLFSGEGWSRAYYNSVAIPRVVKMIDYLELVKPHGELGFGRMSSFTAWHVVHYWVRANSPKGRIEWIMERSPFCEGIADLIVKFTELEESSELDSLELSLAKIGKYVELWLPDLKKRLTLVVSTEGEGFAIRYPAEADFYSPVLGKMVNLAHIFELGK